MNAGGSQARSLKLLDFAALWGSLGASLYILPFGSLLVPALSIERAVLAAVLASAIGAALIGAVSLLGARTGESTHGLLSWLLGPGSSAPLGLLLIARNIAFAALALALIADAAELVSERALGAGMRPLWVVIFGTAGAALVLAGPEFVVRKLLRRGGIWIVFLLAAGVTLSAYMEFEVPAYLTRPAVGGWPSFWQAVDVMLVLPLLWLPVVADYGRLGASPRGAGLGAFAGLFLASGWFSVLGIIYLPAVERGDVSGFVVGMNLGVGALIVLLLLQVDDIFANLYPTGDVLASLPLSVGQMPAISALAMAAMALAAGLSLADLEPVLLVVGSAFVPLFGALLAAHAVRRPEAQPAVTLLAWAAGFAAYQWIAPPDGRWHEAMQWLFADTLGLPFPLTNEVTWLGAAIPSFALGFVLQFTGSLLGSAGRGLHPAPRRAEEWTS